MPDRPPSLPASQVTPESLHADRRKFLVGAGLFAAAAAGVGGGLYALMQRRSQHPVATPPRTPKPLSVSQPVDANQPVTEDPKRFDTDETQTSFDDVTTYNNFYEFGTGKQDPARNAHTLKPRPWAVVIDGLVKKPQTVDLDQLLKWFPLEERIYRMRCVEAWSMVIPWLGIPLGKLIDRVEPSSKAKYVAFETLLDPEQMPGQKGRALPWPYVEALRLDEARNPLTLLAAGLYGKELLGQNGAPLRLVVPWKYGFKGIKTITRITFTEEQPPCTWNEAGPDEYGFYANVNPQVDHPRWSQATERRIGELRRRDTLLFNGYGEWVADLYKGLDLRRNF